MVFQSRREDGPLRMCKDTRPLPKYRMHIQRRPVNFQRTSEERAKKIIRGISGQGCYLLHGNQVESLPRATKSTRFPPSWSIGPYPTSTSSLRQHLILFGLSALVHCYFGMRQSRNHGQQPSLRLETYEQLRSPRFWHSPWSLAICSTGEIGRGW